MLEADELADLVAAIRRRRMSGLDDTRIRSDLSSGRIRYELDDLNQGFAELARQAERRWWPGDDASDGGALISPPLRADCWYPGPAPDPDESPRWTAIQVGLRRRFGDGSPIEESVDTTSTRIVSLLADPRTPNFSRRGLVLGYVQSGKTTNFTAVAAKAADVGYKLIIVLTGTAENLRIQTQERLDSDLTLNNDERVAPYWSRLTTPGELIERPDGSTRRKVGDFPTAPTATPEQALASPNLASYAVVKKNVARLRNLHKFLSANSDLVARTPILLIDDEADQASIDTSDARDAAKRSRINEWVLKLLSLGRVAYLGYTATPFANLFVDPRFQEGAGTFDIYPRDFIYALPEPESGYFGSRRLFGAVADPEADPDEDDGGADVIREVSDSEASSLRAGANVPADTPAALADAIRYFLLATAARRRRSHAGEHSTMLVHTSSLTAVHRALLTPVENHLNDLKAALGVGNSRVLEELRSLWESEVGRFDPDEAAPFESFDEVLGALPEVLDRVRVIEENSYSSTRLVYSQDGGDVFIVVGGNTLSRGLTLEGLVVSYFVRSSTAYDVLLQMGRWFGYRPGYADLPRVWMTKELEDYFEHLARVELELRGEIERYEQDPDVTPLDLGVRIRAHPRMTVTARAKMQRAHLQRSDFGERVHQTTHFDLSDALSLGATIDRTRDFLGRVSAKAGERHDLGTSVVFHDVPVGLPTGFLGQYPFHADESWHEAKFLAYVRAEEEAGMRWNVAVIGSTTEEFGDSGLLDGAAIRFWNRSRYEGDPARADIGALRNAGRDEVIDLTLDLRAPNQSAPRRFADRLGHPRFSRHALLVLYPVAKGSTYDGRGRKNERKKRVDLDSPEDLVGLMLVFPKTRNPAAGVYYELDPDLLAQAEESDEVDVDTDADDAS